jgi:hypothetical protein
MSIVVRKQLWRGRHITPLFAFFVVWALPNAYAQRTFEVTPFLGYRYGGKITLMGNPDTDFLKIESTANYGALTDVTIWKDLQGEFVWSRQPTSLTAHNPTDGTYAFLSKMTMDSYLFGVTYNFGEPKAKLRPFAGLLFGFSHFAADPINGQPVLNFTNRSAFNISGGAKYFFTKNLGIRMETR